MYEMKPEYYIGIDMIDEEHKQLFKYADEAYELLHDENTPDKYDRIDMILEELRDYTAKHFNDEEQYMESINYKKIIYVFLTIFLYLLKCPQSLILSALRAFCFCGKPHISRSIFLYFRYQAWLKSW
ncbi:MAG: bacteriohemerythrin [Agathobacter rectalis]